MLTRHLTKAATRLLTRSATTLTGQDFSPYVLQPSQDPTQFSKANLKNHGELEDGEIPEALKYSRHCSETQLPNGLKIAVEPSYSELAHLSVFVRSGVRNENMKNNGVGALAAKLRLKGTEKRDQTKLGNDVEDIGGSLRIEPGRQFTRFHVQVPKSHVAQGFDVLADLVNSSKFNKNKLEEARGETLCQIAGQHKNAEKFVLENIHYTAFRDHMFGQPLLGNQKTVQNLTVEQVQEYVNAHYVGGRMAVVATGAVDAKQVQQLADQYFGKLPNKTVEVTGDDKPVFTGSQIQIRDDDVDLAHSGIFYQAPSWKDEDFFAFQVLQRITGDYIPERDSIINHPHLQYNHLHTHLGEIEDLGIHKSYYLPYGDVGLYGHFGSSLDMSAFWLPHACLKATRRYTSYVMDSELYRARNKYYNELMDQDFSLKNLADEIGNQVLYAGRRVHRSEVAKRVSLMDNRFLEKTYAKWLWDCELAMAFYGPIFLQIRSYGIWRGYTNNTNQI